MIALCDTILGDHWWYAFRRLLCNIDALGLQGVQFILKRFTWTVRPLCTDSKHVILTSVYRIDSVVVAITFLYRLEASTTQRVTTKRQKSDWSKTLTNQKIGFLKRPLWRSIIPKWLHVATDGKCSFQAKIRHFHR
jgi:hypothetical protein